MKNFYFLFQDCCQNNTQFSYRVSKQLFKLSLIYSKPSFALICDVPLNCGVPDSVHCDGPVESRVNTIIRNIRIWLIPGVMKMKRIATKLRALPSLSHLQMTDTRTLDIMKNHMSTKFVRSC